MDQDMTVNNFTMLLRALMVRNKTKNRTIAKVTQNDLFTFYRKLLGFKPFDANDWLLISRYFSISPNFFVSKKMNRLSRKTLFNILSGRVQFEEGIDYNVQYILK